MHRSRGALWPRFAPALIADLLSILQQPYLESFHLLMIDCLSKF